MIYPKTIKHAAIQALTTIVILAGCVRVAPAQTPAIVRVDLSVGRSQKVSASSGVSRVSVANPDIADALAMSPYDVVINAKMPGETDVMLWSVAGAVSHYRVSVRAPADRMQILLSVKFAEVRREALTEMGLSALYRTNDVRIGTGVLKTDNSIDPVTGAVTLPSESQFLTILSDLGTQKFLVLLEVQKRLGKARILAEPNIMAGNKEDANFLAGGEIPIPIAQGTIDARNPTVTIQFREFGIRLNFNGEIISDSLIKLKVRPEVSSLDYSNAVVLSGFRVPALRTRRVESTLDVHRDQSLIISGLFNDEREKVRTGVPGLMDIPILGAIFSSTSWLRNETELLVIVTPIVIDPMRPRPQDVVSATPDTRRPAAEALERDTKQRTDVQNPPVNQQQ